MIQRVQLAQFRAALAGRRLFCAYHIKTILDDAGVDHVVTKGCHTREVYYEKPALRPAEDIDILISPRDKRDYGWRKAEALGVRR